MSTAMKNKKISVNTILKMKKNGEKISMLTAYDFSTAKYLDEAGVEMLLIGDSVGMTVLGYDSTINVTVGEMKLFTGAVARGAKSALIVADMPFMSVQTSKEQAVQNAADLIRAGADAVKIEGVSDYIVDVVSHLTNSGIPVVAHLGFTPQYVRAFGGYFVQGKTSEKSLAMLEGAKQLQAAGAFALVLEMVPEETAKMITERLQIPVIGIGAGRFCDGQVLVVDDLIGKYGEFTPKFVKKYADVKDIIKNSAQQYVNDVKSGIFPAKENVFAMPSEEREKIECTLG